LAPGFFILRGGFEDSRGQGKQKDKTLTGDTQEVEKILKALIKSLENEPLPPWTLESLDPQPIDT